MEFKTLQEWLKAKQSEQFNKRNEAFNFAKENGIKPKQIAFNSYAIKWSDGEVYVYGRSYKKDGELGKRIMVRTAAEELDKLAHYHDESAMKRLMDFMEAA